MAEYHVGNGLAEIYAGTLTKDKSKWINKSVVTEEALLAVFRWLAERADEGYEEFGDEFEGYSYTYKLSQYEVVMRKKGRYQ